MLHSTPSSLLLLTLSVIFFSSPASAWGSLGHRTVAYLASLYFTPAAQHFSNILLNGQDISEAALFPDKVAHIPSFAYSRSWHYIDARDDPPRSCGVNVTRDCTGPSGCVVSAIANHTARVVDLDLPRFYRGQSLRFVLHFFGDIHQPLHTEAEDRGGNGIPVVFDGKHTNLHSVWDTMVPNKHARGVVDKRRKEEDELEAAMLWAQKLKTEKPLNDECVHDAAECALLWASEANRYVCDYVLKGDVDGLPEDLGGEYYDGAVPIVDEMVGKAGRRLAAWVNAMAESNLLLTQEADEL